MYEYYIITYVKKNNYEINVVVLSILAFELFFVDNCI